MQNPRDDREKTQQQLPMHMELLESNLDKINTKNHF